MSITEKTFDEHVTEKDIGIKMEMKIGDETWHNAFLIEDYREYSPDELREKIDKMSHILARTFTGIFYGREDLMEKRDDL